MIKKISFLGPLVKKDSETWSWSIKLFEKVIVPVFADLGYQLIDRENLETEGTSLSFAVIEQLTEDNLVVADLTSKEPGVFYKLAIRHILQKPVLHLIQQGIKNSFEIDGMQLVEINIDSFEEIERSKLKLKEQIYLLENETEMSLPYVTYLQQLLTIFEDADSNKNKDVIYNLLNQFENINASLSYAKEDLVLLSDQLIYKKQEVPPSPFVERRLAKVELYGRQKKGAKFSNRRSGTG